LLRSLLLAGVISPLAAPADATHFDRLRHYVHSTSGKR